jgi:putative transposase
VVVNEAVDEVLKNICLEIGTRWEIYFLEIGLDGDHAHFLIQSVRNYSVTKMVRTVKSIVAREVFEKVPEVKKKLWGGEFWGKGYFINTVGQYRSEKVIAEYVAKQGGNKNYKQLHKGQLQLDLF